MAALLVTVTACVLAGAGLFALTQNLPFTTGLYWAVILRKQAPDLPITAQVSSASVREALRELGVQHAVSAQELVARTLATTLETPHAGEMVAQLVESGRDILAEIDAARRQNRRCFAVLTQSGGYRISR